MLFPTGTVFNVSIPILLFMVFDMRNRYNEVVVPLFLLLIPTAFLNMGQRYMDFKSIVRLMSIALVFYTFV